MVKEWAHELAMAAAVCRRLPQSWRRLILCCQSKVIGWFWHYFALSWCLCAQGQPRVLGQVGSGGGVLGESAKTVWHTYRPVKLI